MDPETPRGDRQDVLKRALVEMKQLRAKIAQLERQRNEPIAIVGLSCRFPGGANNPDAFWQMLADGVDGTCEVPADRWDADAHFDSNPDALGKMYTRRGGFLNSPVDEFDAEFFGISPREAMTMDPQQRMLLELTWEALENAGQAPDKLLGSDTGVFVGISTNDYAEYSMFADPVDIDAYTATGNALNCAAGRVAFVLGLQGPALAIDTACSSSLVAVHVACQSLRNQECRMAVAGGISMILSPNGTIATSRARMMAPDGRCKTFDASADGYVRGEGCGLVVLKPLSLALEDGDHVWAVIRGSAVNQDGHSSGLTVPNGAAQQSLLRSAMANAGVEPADVSYLEAHGTGTRLGDPIEVESLKAVLVPGRQPDQTCGLGSVKTNIGHLEAAAGIAGLLKVVLALTKQEIPPHLHLKELNPHIDLKNAPLYIPTEPRAWPAGSKPRIAGVSSFGFSGTNCHVVLAETPQPPEEVAEAERPLHVVALSARNETALAELAERHTAHLDTHASINVADFAFTTNAGRSDFSHRLTVLAESHEQIRLCLSEFVSGKNATGVFQGLAERSTPYKVAFLFTGQGCQYPGMARQLYDTQPTFCRALDRCEAVLKEYLERPLLEVIYGNDAATELLDQTAYTQPALFAVEYALAELWRSWGIEPSVVLGHSVGQYVAACVAGVFSLEDGLKLIAHRSRLMQSLPAGGKMASVATGLQQVAAVVQEYKNDVAIAAVNGPASTVISGREEQVDAVLSELAAAGVEARPLSVSHAFHSPLIEPMLDEFESVAATVDYHTPRIRLISNVSGQTAEPSEMTSPAAWRNHARQPVQFLRSMESMAEQGVDAFVEIGPKPTLLSLGRACLPQSKTQWLPSLRPKRDDWPTMLESLARLYVRGATVDWEGVDRDYPRRRMPLPTYPFQRKPFWVRHSQRKQQTSAVPVEPVGHPYLGQRVLSPLDELQFTARLDVRKLPLVDDHRIHGMAWVNLVVYLEMGLAAAGVAYGNGPHMLRDLTVSQGMILPDDGERIVQITLSRNAADAGTFRVFSLNKSTSDWKLHAAGKIEIGTDLIADENSLILPAEIQGRCPQEISSAEFYDLMESHGARLGKTCRRIDRIWRRDGEALARLLPTDAADSQCILDQTAVDAGLQLFGVILPDDVPHDFLLCGLEHFRYSAAAANVPLWCHAVLKQFDGETATGDVRVLDDEGNILVEAVAAKLQRAGREWQQAAEESSSVSAADNTPRLTRDEILAVKPEERPTILADFLAEQLSCSLGCPPNREAPIVEQVDSLVAVEVKNRIAGELELDVPVAAFFEGNNVQQLAELMLQQLLSESVAADCDAVTDGRGAMSVDALAAEAVLAEDIDPCHAMPYEETEPRNVLLTGATGFLGAFLLHELLQQTEATIHCLVRAADAEEGRARIYGNFEEYLQRAPLVLSRIVPIVGDLSQSLLGLTGPQFEQLAAQMDAVYHCGAVVKWTYPYASLRDANVGGTHELLRLACRAKVKPFHFVSTVGVFSSPDFPREVVLETEPLESSGPLSVGYAQSKWVAEKLVTLAHKRGLPVSIYRPNIGAHSESGAFNRHDHVYQMLKGCVQLGIAPDLELEICGAPVDFVSQAIVRLSRQTSSQGSVFHLVDDATISWRQLVQWVGKNGYSVRLVKYDKWRDELERAIAEGSDNALVALSPLFTESVLEQVRLPRFDCKNTFDGLDGTLTCPPLDEKRLATSFLHNGWLGLPDDNPITHAEESEAIRV